MLANTLLSVYTGDNKKSKGVIIIKKLFTVILSFVLALSAAACSTGNTDVSNSVETTAAATVSDEMKENMDSTLKKNYFEGIVCLTQNGSVIYQSATGKDENGADLTVDTTMYIGSVSKQFCAAAILLLRDQGKLSLDDTLDKYFLEYSEGKNITLKNLLSMRSGIPDMISEGEVKGISPDNSEAENTATVKEWIFSQPLLFEPDSSWSYSNSNYFLLGNIVEQVSGQTYNDFIRKNIFEPLEMTHSGFVNEVKDAPAWASGLTYDTFTAGEDAEGLTKGAGDIASNAADMDKWMTGLRSGKVISLDSYHEMTDDYSPDMAKKYGYGLVGMFDGGVGHSGLIGSYTAGDYINEEHGYNLFIASNKNYMQIEGLPSALLSDLIDKE